MAVKLIAMDLDGTLLNSQKTVSEKDAEALQAAADRGILLAAATGRPLCSVPSCIRDNPVFSYLITSNGAEVYRCDPEEQVYSVNLNAGSVEKILEIVGERKVGWEAFVMGQAYGEADYVEQPWKYGIPPSAVGYIKKTRKPVQDIRQFIRDNKKRMAAVDLLIPDREQREAIMKELKECGEALFVTAFMEPYIEIQHGAAGKASGIRQICRMERIDEADTAAVGDADNDLDMLQFVGTGIAMKNSHETVKALADYVTEDNDHSGVGAALRNCLGILPAEEQKLHEKYMREALRQADKAEALEEVPIGCVIVKDGKIIARGYNRRNTDKNTLSHAELNAIRKASGKLGDWRLEGCTMYITLEPCQMCAGALVQSRIDRIVLGGRNPKAGCAGSVLNLLQIKAFNHQVEVIDGILTEECSSQLSRFFQKLRKQRQK